MLSRIKQKNIIKSDFLACLRMFPNEKIFFVDVGCRDEPVSDWPKSREGIVYVGFDANDKVIQDLEKSLVSYTGKVNADFVCQLISGASEDEFYGTSNVGMTDRIVSSTEIDGLIESGWEIKKSKTKPLDESLQAYQSYIDSSEYLKVLKIDVEGYANVVIDRSANVRKFDIIICEFLPQMLNQFSAMAEIESAGFKIVNVERAYRHSPINGRELFIIDTMWQNEKFRASAAACGISHVNILNKIYSYALFFVVSLIYKAINKKTNIGISDAELGW